MIRLMKNTNSMFTKGIGHVANWSHVAISTLVDSLPDSQASGCGYKLSISNNESFIIQCSFIVIAMNQTRKLQNSCLINQQKSMEISINRKFLEVIISVQYTDRL